jgi:dipeptidyl aminopeptidase/acylaminoacyl peptidase
MINPVNGANKAMVLTRITAAPALLFHGEKDANVPLQQSQRMVDALKKAGVPAELMVKRGVGHGWADNKEDTAKIIGWWKRHLLKKEAR